MVNPTMFKYIKNYEVIGDSILIHYQYGASKIIKKLSEEEKKVYETVLSNVLVEQMKEKVNSYEEMKQRQKISQYDKDLPKWIQVPGNLLTNALCVAAIVGMTLIHPASSIEILREESKKARETRKDIRITKLYLDNIERLEKPVCICDQEVQITPNNIENFSYKQLKKAIKQN